DESNHSKVPIVLFVDGSGCYSARRESLQSFWKLPEWTQAALLIVDKPGMKPGMGVPKACPDEFANYYSVDQRVFDHLRAIQYLRKNAAWWNGEIRLFGWSDGGAMGAHIAAYTPEVVRAVLGGMGGAIPMSQQFEDFIICAEDRLQESQSKQDCVQKLRVQFQEIRDNPTSKKTWSGDHNTYKAWSTRLDQMEYYLMRELTIPFLVVHGELDRDGTPVQSARLLVDWLRRDDVTNFEY
ncbi:S9 family peptidase, partial [Microbulbifer sp. 2205BS26-8]|uniref:alpha/beta hydrolase family protein n=1 Tax=Microbulbifer sp. 2205BS26-8 TaxID=3064386 RepID=UPI00273E7DE7